MEAAFQYMHSVVTSRPFKESFALITRPPPMTNPYAPPAAAQNVPEKPSNTDKILRRIGAMSLGYLLVSALLRESLPEPASSVFAVAVMGTCIYGFLRGGRKFHLSIALFMALTIFVQAYLQNRAIAHPERIPVEMGPHPWLDFARAIEAHVLALACASALYFRARRASKSAADQAGNAQKT